MWEEILRIAMNYGIWAALFVGLMVYILRDTNKREKKYQETIETLVSCLKIVEEIQENMTELKRDIVEIKLKARIRQEREVA